MRQILVLNRSFDRAQALAERVEGRPIRFDDWARDSVDATILAGSTAAPHPLMTVAKLEPIMGRRRRHPVFTHHRLGLPRDVEPGARKFDGVYLYDLDCLEIIPSSAIRAFVMRKWLKIRLRDQKVCTTTPLALRVHSHRPTS